jgi:multidrug resistance efflux pump
MNEHELIDNPDKINLTRNRHVDESLGSPPRSILTFGPTIILILVVLLFTLSWIIKYPDVLSSKAIITTPIPPQKEYARISGKIDTIFVEDNQLVQPSTPLAILENTANFSDVFYLKSIVEKININFESIYFPFDTIPNVFLGEIEEEFSSFENSYILYQLNEKLQPFSNESSANQLTLGELNDRLQSLNAQNELFQTEILIKQNDLDRFKTLFDKGVISSQEYENKQLDFYQAKRNLQNISLAISQLKEAKNGTNKTLKSIEINKTKEEIQLFNATLQSFNLLKKAIKDWELKYVLQSNIEGKVSFLNYWNKNQSVNEGDLLFTIIPNKNNSFLAKLKTPSQNSGKIKIGQTVNIKLENYPSNEFGMLKGKVTSISLVPDQDGFYLIDVTLSNKLVTTYNKKIDFKQEMKADAEIITEDLRLIERLFYQFKKIIRD